MVYKENELFAAMGTFVPSRLHLTLVDEIKKNITYGKLLTPEHEAIFVHEHIHFFQTAFTGYGQISWNIYRQLVSYIITEWKDITEEFTDLKRPLPFGHIARRGNLKAAVNAFFRYKVYIESFTLQNLRSYSNPLYNLISDYNMQYINEPWQISPIIMLDGREYKLQGKDIMESHAKFLEAIYSFRLNKIPFDQTMDKTKLHETYWMPYFWFIQELGFERIDEFPIICDLALQTVWCDLPKTEEEWRESHPAWRFIKLIKTVKSLDLQSFRDHQHIKLNYTKYVNDLLNHCNYKSLDEVIEEALSRYERRDCGIVLPLEMRMKEPLLYRRNYPWCGANPFLDLDVWTEMKTRFNVPLLQIGPELQIVSANGVAPESGSEEEEALAIENIFELHLQAFACQIVGVTSNYLTDIDHLQCGFGYFGIKCGCAYQELEGCPGSFNPKEGLPMPLEFKSEKVVGCQFGMLLTAHGINEKDIDLNFNNKKMISVDELIQMSET